MSEAAVSSRFGPGSGFARMLSDDRLTRRAVAGDQHAFAAIFRRYHQGLYRFCLAIVGNPEDAQDALQNTMAKVLRSLPGEERQIELKPWLYRIAHNESIDVLRRRRETRTLDVELAAPGGGLSEEAATRERLRRLLADMGELPERQREVLVMRELGGLDFAEIGMALGTSDAVARQTLYEARQSLRQMEEGREMSCDAVSRALSDGDGRVLRRRDVRAHLRACSDCRRFRDGIKERRRDFAALSPLPAAASAALLHGLLGGSGNGGLAATLTGGTAKSLGASAALKGAATVAVVAALGTTAADRTGLIHLGLPGDHPATETSGAAAGGSAVPAGAGSRGAAAAPAGTVGRSMGAGSTAHLRRVHAADRAAAGAVPGEQPPVAGSRSEARGKSTAAHERAHPRGHLEHPQGKGHVKQHPAAAGHGQETAAAHKAGPKAGEHPPAAPAHPVQPAHPATPPPSHGPSPPSGSGTTAPAEPQTQPALEPEAEIAPQTNGQEHGSTRELSTP